MGTGLSRFYTENHWTLASNYLNFSLKLWQGIKYRTREGSKLPFTLQHVLHLLGKAKCCSLTKISEGMSSDE